MGRLWLTERPIRWMTKKGVKNGLPLVGDGYNYTVVNRLKETCVIRNLMESCRQIMLSILKPSDLRLHWNRIEPMLASALDMSDGEYSAADLLREGLEGKRDFWLVFDVTDKIDIHAVLTTFILNAPQKKTWFVHIAYGNESKAWLDEVADVFLREAVLSGCSAIQMNGRRGWEKKLARYGMKQISTIFERRIGDEDRTNYEQRTKNNHEHVGNLGGNVGAQPEHIQ